MNRYLLWKRHDSGISLREMEDLIRQKRNKPTPVINLRTGYCYYLNHIPEVRGPYTAEEAIAEWQRHHGDIHLILEPLEQANASDEANSRGVATSA